MAFKRENKYLVLKVKDIQQSLTDEQKIQLAALACEIEKWRDGAGKPKLECVVVESDWPNYEDVWKSVEQAAKGMYGKPAVGVEDSLIQKMFDAGMFGAMGYAELMVTLFEKGVVPAIYDCECSSCGNCAPVIEVGILCDNCEEGRMVE